MIAQGSLFNTRVPDPFQRESGAPVDRTKELSSHAKEQINQQIERYLDLGVAIIAQHNCTELRNELIKNNLRGRIIPPKLPLELIPDQKSFQFEPHKISNSQKILDRDQNLLHQYHFAKAKFRNKIAEKGSSLHLLIANRNSLSGIAVGIRVLATCEELLSKEKPKEAFYYLTASYIYNLYQQQDSHPVDYTNTHSKYQPSFESIVMGANHSKLLLEGAALETLKGNQSESLNPFFKLAESAELEPIVKTLQQIAGDDLPYAPVILDPNRIQKELSKVRNIPGLQRLIDNVFLASTHLTHKWRT